MKIALFIPSDFIFPLVEGCRKQVWLHALELKKRKYDVEILCFNKRILQKNSTSMQKGINITSFSKLRPPKIKTDILHIFGSVSPDLIPIIKKAKFKSLFLSIFDGNLCKFWESPFSRIAYKTIKNKISMVFVQTNYQKKLASKFFQNIKILPPLIPKIKHTNAKPNKTPIILFMSHLSKYKGIYVLLKAFKKVIEKIPNAKLVIADSGLGPDRKRIEKYISRAGFSNVIFKGLVNPIEELVSAWIYVYPILSCHNTFSIPMSLFESQLTNTKFICSKVGGISEYVKENFLIKPGDKKDLSSKIIKSINSKKKIKPKKMIFFPENNKTISCLIKEYKSKKNFPLKLKENYMYSYTTDKQIAHYYKIFSHKVDSIIHDLEKHFILKLIKKFGASKRSKILDVACGFGRIAKFLEKEYKNVAGIDNSNKMLNIAKKKCEKTKFYQGDVEKLPFIKSSFDFITCFRFIMNFRKPIRINMLKEINRVLKKEGLLICNLHRNSLGFRGIYSTFRNKILGYDEPNLSYKILKKELENAQFKIEKYVGIKLIPYWRHFIFLPYSFLFTVEKFLGTIPFLRYFSDGIIIIARKK